MPPTAPIGAELAPVDDVDQSGDLDSGADLLSITDSLISWTLTLRLAHTLTGLAALPDRVVEQLEAAGLTGTKLRLRLTHDGYELRPAGRRPSHRRCLGQLADTTDGRRVAA